MKAHRTDGVSLSFALIFLAMVGWWLAAQVVTVRLPALGWFAAVGLILFGGVGLLGALRSGRAGTDTGPDRAGTDTGPDRAGTDRAGTDTGPDRAGTDTGFAGPAEGTQGPAEGTQSPARLAGDPADHTGDPADHTGDPAAPAVDPVSGGPTDADITRELPNGPDRGGTEPVSGPPGSPARPPHGPA